MTIQIPFLTDSVVNRITKPLRNSVVFYAPLESNLYFMGIEPCTFTRSGTSTATWHDGGSHNVATNEPRFEWQSDLPRGLLLTSSAPTESLQFNAANSLHDANTIFWIQEGVVKKTTADTNPFNSSGVWTGASGSHLRRILKFNKVLSASELAYIEALLLL